jgi:hypothetical protein
MSIVSVYDGMCVVQGRRVSFNQLIPAMTAAADTELIKPWGKGERHAKTG